MCAAWAGFVSNVGRGGQKSALGSSEYTFFGLISSFLTCAHEIRFCRTEAIAGRRQIHKDSERLLAQNRLKLIWSSSFLGEKLANAWRIERVVSGDEHLARSGP